MKAHLTVFAMFLLLTALAVASIPGDLNNDGTVDIFDLVLVATNFGKTSGYDQRADANQDGKVDIFDLVLVAQHFGRTERHDGLWISREELAQLPMSGQAWDFVKSTADGSWGTADIADQNNKHAVKTLAGALVYARTGQDSYRQRVRSAIMAAIGTEEGGRTLALGRSVAAYVIAADLIDLKNYPSDDRTFRAWLAEVRTKRMAEHRWVTLTQTHENAANNWAAFAGASRIAASLYLGDTADVDRSSKILQAWMGDRSKYPPDAPGQDGYFQKSSSYDPSWVCNDAAWVAVNPPCTKSGINLNGALVEDINRGGGLSMPPDHDGMSYSWEALQGYFVQAELLHRAGYDSYSWSDQALKRAMAFMEYAGWDITNPGKHVPWVANSRYGTSHPTEAAGYGRIMGYTDWTHQ